MPLAAPPASLVLVHGAWHGPWMWSALRTELARLAGYDVRTVDLPSSGPDPATLGDLDDDVRAIRDALDAVDGPTVVVAHSYGGLPATEAVCGAPRVIGVVYIAAFVADADQPLAGLAGQQPPEWWDVHPAEGYIDALEAERVFYADVEPATAREAAARLTHQSLRTSGRPLRDAAWRHVPTSYVVCDRDQAIPPAVQTAMARHARRVHHLPSSHSPFLSMPGDLATLLHAEIDDFCTQAGLLSAS
jgi:pimeloyl-ACP methyl ester carboxylesterase